MRHINVFQALIRQLVLVLLAIAYMGTAWSSEPIIIRFAHSSAADSPKGKMARRFKELVAQKLGDQNVQVQVYPNGYLFADTALIPALLKNRVQIIATPIANLKPYSKRMQLFDLPFLFVSEKAASRFLQGEYGSRILRLLGRRGLLGLGYLNNGMKQLSSSNRVLVPEDVKNLKFLIADSDVTDFQFRTVQARPIVGSLTKAATVIASGAVDGQENTWSNIYTQQIYQHQAYILESNHVYLADMILTSKTVWQSIPERFHRPLKSALKSAIDYGNTLAAEQSTREKQLILDSGLSEISAMTVEQREQWIESMQDVWKHFENDIGSDLINAAASQR